MLYREVREEEGRDRQETKTPYFKIGTEVHAYNPRVHDVESRRSRVEGLLQLHEILSKTTATAIIIMLVNQRI